MNEAASHGLNDVFGSFQRKDGVIMQAKKYFLETDQHGQLIHPPKLPPNARMEAIFLIIEDKMNEKRRREPSPAP